MLLARYIFDDPKNFNKDYSGKTTSSIGGTITLSDKTAPGFEKCAYFNGSSYVKINNKPTPTNAITVSWWGYMDNWSNYGIAVSCTDTGGWNFEPNNSKLSVPCYVKGIGYKSVFDDTALASLSKGWHNFAFTFYNGALKFYRDGALKQSIATGGTEIEYNASNNLFIGCEAGGTSPSGNYFTGSISDVRIYSEALSDSQIKHMYENPNSITIRSDNKLVISGSIKEGETNINFNKLGNIDCNRLIEVPVFTSASAYAPENCLEYSFNRDSVNWEQSHIVENKGAGWSTGNIICLIIPSTDNKYYVSYQKVVNDNTLSPLKNYRIQDNNKPFITVGKDKKIYCGNFIED